MTAHTNIEPCAQEAETLKKQYTRARRSHIELVKRIAKHDKKMAESACDALGIRALDDGKNND